MKTLWLLLLATGCGSGPDDSTDTSACGDLDGTGSDTGNLPGVLGRWTVSFGTNNYTDGCGVADFDNTSEDWLLGAMEVRGRVPDALYAVFDDEEERFYGLQAANGGIVFSGTHEDDRHGTMWTSMGGLVYLDTYRDRTVIEGFGFIGLDTLGDGEIDCYARGDFEAFKSGF